MFRTIRKFNGFVTLATQSPLDVQQGNARKLLQTMSEVFLYRGFSVSDAFLSQDLELSPHQIEQLKDLREDDQRREVFYASRRGMNRILSVEIPPALYWFVTTDGQVVLSSEMGVLPIEESRIKEKWRLQPGDKDMIVMEHQFEYEVTDLPGRPLRLKSSLVVTGENEQNTAMAQTVGLPLAITVRNFLAGNFKLYGVQIPTKREIYEPMLQELEEHRVIFHERLMK